MTRIPGVLGAATVSLLVGLASPTSAAPRASDASDRLMAAAATNARVHGATRLVAPRSSERVADTLVIGVFPFAADPADTLLAPLSYALADLLVTDLSRSRRVTLVERARLQSVLRELSLAASGALDPASAPRAGRLARANTIVTGALRRRGPADIVFETRVSQAATGRVDPTLSAAAPINDILAAEKAIAYRLFDQFGVVLTPQERALIEQRPTNNVAALLAYGQGVRAEVNGQYAVAARAFRRAAAADPSFTRAIQRASEARTAGSGAVRTAINGVNRPLETVPTTLRPGLATDPALGGSRATITIDINRP